MTSVRKNMAGLSQRYRIEKYEVGVKNYHYWAPSNLEDLLNELSENDFQKDERLPYWCHLWPSARVLIEYFSANPELYENRQVLELGCGLGIVSIFLAGHCRNLLAVDYEPDALQFARCNFLENLKGFPERTMLTAMDWREMATRSSFDLIFGADILYENRFFEPLERLIHNHSHSRTQLIFTEPGRKISLPFFERLSQIGYRHQTHIYPFKTSDGIDQKVYTHVFSLTNN